MKLILKKSPLQLFSKSLVALKHLQWIQKDLDSTEITKKAYKILYLNQSYIIHLVALWEVFIEQEVKTGFEEMLRLSHPGIFESQLRAKAKSSLDMFHNANVKNINSIFKKILGIENISDAWYWDGMPQHEACAFLKEIIKTRHEIGHVGKSSNNLSFDKNFEYMKHVYNLAYLTSREVDKNLATLSGEEFNKPKEMPYPTSQ